MLNIERARCKGVNPFCSHLQDKKSGGHITRHHTGEKKAGSRTGFSCQAELLRPQRQSFHHPDHPPLCWRDA